MKYGESTFDILYLVFGFIMGVRILRVKKDAVGKLMGAAVLILVCGDAFHLVPRVLQYFVKGDFTAWLGIGKLVTSITMTVFYVLLYRLWLIAYDEREDRKMTACVYALTAARVVLCLMPQNRWLQNEGSVLWGVIRNVPFVVLGALVVMLYHRDRMKIPRFRNVWLLIIFSFIFYIPVAVAASIVPMLGMLMLPKTVCYIMLIWIFWKYAAETKAR